MPAFVELPWLSVRPSDFLQAAEAGARQALAAGASRNTPRLVNSGLPFVSGGSGARPETELQKAETALALARANALTKQMETPEEQPAAPPVLKYQGIGTGGVPGVLDRTTGQFVPLPTAPSASPETLPRTIPIMIPGAPNPITGESADKIIQVPPSIAASLFQTGPESLRTNAFNQAIAPLLKSKTAPTQSGTPKIPQAAIDYLKQNPATADKFDAMFGAGTSGSILGASPAPDANGGYFFMGNPDDEPADEEQANPGINIQTQ